MLKDYQDAYGHQMYDYLTKGRAHPVIERDDNLVDIDAADMYFSEFEKWPEIDRQAMHHVKGRVLDIGCGAGRHSLYLQEQGHEVVGIDISPLVIEVARQMGLRDVRVCAITQINKSLGKFDTVLMLGNNFSLVGTPKRAKWLLRKLYNLTGDDGRIIAQTIDPYDTSDPDHLAYHEANRKKGKMGGEARIRVRYKKYITPWIDFLMVSKPEMETLLEGTGWRVENYMKGRGGAHHGVYTAILEKS